VLHHPWDRFNVHHSWQPEVSGGRLLWSYHSQECRLSGWERYLICWWPALFNKAQAADETDHQLSHKMPWSGCCKKIVWDLAIRNGSCFGILCCDINSSLLRYLAARDCNPGASGASQVPILARHEGSWLALGPQVES